MELSKRLKSVADMVTRTNTVADVGCDHGYVPIYLIRQGLARQVIAMDVNEGPLARARQNVEREGLGGYIQTRLSDGLAALGADEAQTVICSGMGGRLMMRILSEGGAVEKGVRELVLQPQSEIAKVRRYLYQTGFSICEEAMVCDDGKYYQIMRAVLADSGGRASDKEDLPDRKPEETGENLTEIQAVYGPCLLQNRDQVLLEFLRWERKKYRELSVRVESANPERAGELREKCLLTKEALERYFDEL